MVQQCMDVDDELQPTRLSRVLTAEGEYLIIDFHAADSKILRVGVSSFLDMVTVAAKTILEFGGI